MRIVRFNDLANDALEDIAVFIVEESHSIDIALNFVNKLRRRVRNRLESFPNLVNLCIQSMELIISKLSLTVIFLRIKLNTLIM